MSNQFLRIETQDGFVRWVNTKIINVIQPRDQKSFETGATVIVSDGKTALQFVIAPGENTRRITDFLGINK